MKAKTLFFGCSDPRLQPMITKMAKEQNLEPYCQIFVPGSVKALFDKDKNIMNFFAGQLLFLCEKFSVEQVIFVGHEGCNAYGINNRDYEKVTQLKDIDQAEQLIRLTLPHIKIIRLWGILDPAQDTIVELQTI